MHEEVPLAVAVFTLGQAFALQAQGVVALRAGFHFHLGLALSPIGTSMLVPKAASTMLMKASWCR
jgi:hypothetical protein